jgi:hypothetical protein
VGLDEQLVAPLDLLEEGTVEGVADIQQVGVAQGEQLLHRVVVALAGQEEAEVHHLDRPECHGELLLDINIIRPVISYAAGRVVRSDTGGSDTGGSDTGECERRERSETVGLLHMEWRFGDE